jgi:hypothetical protein
MTVKEARELQAKVEARKAKARAYHRARYRAEMELLAEAIRVIAAAERAAQLNGAAEHD